MTAEEARRIAHEARRRLVTASLATAGVFAIGIVGYLLIDRGEHSWLDSVYMTVITLTTVGYGEIIPLEGRPWGRAFTIALLLGGMGVIVYFTSSVTAFIVEGTLKDVFRRNRMRRSIDALRGHFILCGSGEVVRHVAEELDRVQRPFVVVTGPTAEEIPGGPEALVVRGDATDEEALAAAGIARASGLVAGLESDSDNALLVLTARQLRHELPIVVAARNERNESKLRRAGATDVVNPTAIGGMRVASVLIRPSVVSFLDSMLRDRDRNLRIEEIEVAPGAPPVGKPIAAMGIDARRDALLLAVIAADGQTRRFKPDPNALLVAGEKLVVMATPEAVSELRAQCGSSPHA